MVIKLDMNELINSEAFMDLFIQKVVDEVIRRIKNRPKTALVCFSGAAIGFKQAMDSLVKLKNDGWQLKVFLSDAALCVLTEDYIRKTLGVDKIHTSQTKTPQRELYADVDQIIIASTTVNTAAKIATGVCDNEMLTLINHGLMAGTPFICAVDGACPDNATRAQLGMGNASDGYRELLKNNLRALKNYGMRLVAAEDLYDACVGTPAGKVTKKEAPKPTACAVPEKALEAPAPVMNPDPFAEDPLTTKRIISRVDIIKNRGKQAVKVSANAIITEYAKDAAKELGICIERV
ncbi:Flavoprotein [Eubacterium barkeri]|uniref:Flavoprotein n=2 Tax=Eubacterium barkeri TaxID=1528 RepID=A0A1H3AYK0_EUBBA|nr:Flavoprotein [Eubacterium barkeri]